MQRRKLSSAKGELRRQLEDIGATEWGELAGVRVAWVHGGTWFEHRGQWRAGQWTVEQLRELLTHSHPARPAEGASEEWIAELMILYELTTYARVTRTEEELRHLTEHLPGPELLRSGVVGRRGLERWAPPRLDGEVLTFYANAPKSRDADFVSVHIQLWRWSISVEVVDQGWFEED